MRLWSRLDLGPLDPADVVRAAAEDASRLQEWHALVVEHGRRTCLAAALAAKRAVYARIVATPLQCLDPPLRRP